MAVSKQHTQVDEHTLNSLPVAVILFDNNAIYFLNKKAVEIFEIPKAQLKNLSKFTILRFLDKKLHSLVKKNNNLILAGAELFAAEREFINYRKKKIVIEASSNSVYFKGKKVIQTTFTEISKRKTQALISEGAKDVLQKISANSQDVIFHFSFNPNLQIKFISDSSRIVLGFTPEQVYNNPGLIKTHVHADDRHLLAISKDDYLKLTPAQREKKIVVRFKHKDGDFKHIEIAVNPVYDKKVLIGLIGNMRDVTERIETENLLIETKNKFDLITNNGNDIIAFYTYYPKEKYLYVSPNIKKILGYDYRQLLMDNEFFTARLTSDKDEFRKSDKLLKKLSEKESA